jgi:hypothetical protein
LSRRANQVHIGIIAKMMRGRAGRRASSFVPHGDCDSPKFVCHILIKFDSSGKSPAYCHHRESIEARAGNGSGLFHFLKSDGGAVCEHATLFAHLALSHARRRSSFVIPTILAGTSERAGGRRAVARARGPLAPRDRVRA